MYSAALLTLRKFHKKSVVTISKPQYLVDKLRYVTEYTQQNAGFTLIEVLVVVLIIAVLAAIASPAWIGFVNRQQVNKANDAIFAALQEAQRQAKKTKRSYSVSFKMDSNVPKFAIYSVPNLASATIPNSTSPIWQSLGGDLALQPGKVLLYTNLDATTANKKASNNVNYSALGSGTVTFDYMGILASKADNSPPDTGLKVAVAIANPNSSTSAGNVRRCVFVVTLIGGMQTAKDNLCNN